MPIEKTELERLLERDLGFERDERHHHWFTLTVNGKVVAVTRTSHSPKARTIDDSLLSKIARHDLHISVGFLKDLLSGRKSRDDYLAELKGGGHL
jgi:hypothetical protein